MGRGIISGVIWGALVAMMSLWVFSQVGGMVGLLANPEGIASVAPSVGSADGGDQIDVSPLESVIADAPVSDLPRQSSDLTQAETEPNPTPETEPTPQPETIESVSEPVRPNVGIAPVVPGQSAGTEPTNIAGGRLLPPTADSLPSVAPETPPVEQVVVSEEVEQPPILPANSSQAALEPEQAPVIGAEPDQPDTPIAEIAPGGDFSTPVVVPTPKVPEPEAEPQTDLEPETETTDRGPQLVPNTVVLDGDGNLESPAPLVDLASNVRTHRLPTIGADGQGDAVAVPDADTELEPEPGSGLAIQQFSEAYDNPNNRPLMAILLLPDGQPTEPSTTFLPFPVSYVVDASQDDANGAMQRFRDGGFEVAAMMPLPERASPQDVEIAFQTYFNRVPEAVAVMDTDSAGFQSGRMVATQVVQVLAATGHGMITYSKGLNSAPQVAEREGVPAALVFRVFDDRGQDGATIKRFLDQAAFRAGQQSGVIMVGHNRPETVKALLEWSLGNRASTVAMAPVSAVLLAK